jgi:hypothetical protein
VPAEQRCKKVSRETVVGIKAENDKLLWSIKPRWLYQHNAAFAIVSTLNR